MSKPMSRKAARTALNRLLKSPDPFFKELAQSMQAIDESLGGKLFGTKSTQKPALPILPTKLLKYRDGRSFNYAADWGKNDVYDEITREEFVKFKKAGVKVVN